VDASDAASTTLEKEGVEGMRRRYQIKEDPRTIRWDSEAG